MLRVFFRIILTISSTSWMLVVYAIKTHYSFYGIPYYICSMLCIITIFVLSVIIIQLTKLMDKDEAKQCNGFLLADNEYIPVYLGYFFVALSVNDWSTMVFIYGMVSILMFMMNAYFNPVFLIFGYHYYHVSTAEGTHFLLISRLNGRNYKNLDLPSLRRINDTTYISHGEE